MYTLPELPYQYDALGPHIGADIMKLHHTAHHQAYIDKLNAALDQQPELKDDSLEHVLQNLDTIPEAIQTAVRNNGGGHYNHALFWQWLSPAGGGEPGGELAQTIAVRYGGFQGFVDEFTTKSLGIFGSGWTWLQPNGDIITTPNQDNPLTLGLPEPVLGLDVWEHAYYLDYKNVRADYLKAWWNVVNWEFAEQRYSDATKA